MAAFLVLATALVIAGVAQVGLFAIGPAVVLGLNALMGWKMERKAEP